MKLAKNEQKHVQTSWAKFQRDIKCGKYRYKFIYALKFIVALTTPIFKETHYHWKRFMVFSYTKLCPNLTKNVDSRAENFSYAHK